MEIDRAFRERRRESGGAFVRDFRPADEEFLQRGLPGQVVDGGVGDFGAG